MAYQGGQRKSAPDPGQVQRAREQQAVLDKIRKGEGGVLSNPIPANPLARIGAFFTAPSGTKIPALQRARLNGEEVLVNKGGFNLNVAGLGEINVGGQRFFPGQSGNDLIYSRGVDENKKRAVGGQYGSLFSKDQLSRPDIVPPAPGDPRSERAYQQEVSRTAQLTAQDPELQRYEDARIKAAAQGATPESVKTAEDIGMQIWAKKYGGPGGLASKVKPGQAGYEAIQGVIAPGRGMPGSTSMYQGAFPTDDYRDYGEPQSPTVGYQMQSPITSVPGLNATTAQQVNTGAQVQAQDLADLFKNAVFDEELMKQIQQYN
jgi:hypothetical protein